MAFIVAWNAIQRPSNADAPRSDVAIFEINPTTKVINQISIHAPGTGASAFTIPGGQYITPNGRYAMAMPTLGSYSVTDLQTGQQVSVWSSSPGKSFPNNMAVSPNATFAGIVSVSTIDQSWSLTLFNLKNTTQFTFGDVVDPATGHNASPNLPLQPKIEGWTGDEAYVILSTGIPNADAPVRYYYKIAMASLTFGPPAPQSPVPLTVQLAPTQQIDRLTFSPDSTKVIFGYADPANTPQHFVSPFMGPGSPMPDNTLVLLDLTTGSTQIIATAGPGQGLNAPAWSLDGTMIYYAAGEFQNTFFVAKPLLRTYIVGTGQTLTGQALTIDPPHHGISDMSACGDTLFMRQIALALDGTSLFGVVVSAPMSNLATQSPVWAIQETVLGPCVPTPSSTAVTVVPSPTLLDVGSIPQSSLQPTEQSPTSTDVGPVQPPAQPAVQPQQSVSCLLAPQLIIGQQGIVTPGNPNNLRGAPLVTSPLIGKIPAGAVFSVLDGPVCDSTSGYNYWQINYNGQIGYTAEGKDGLYYVAPDTSAAPPAVDTGITPTVPVNNLPPAAIITLTPTLPVVNLRPVTATPVCNNYNPSNLTIVDTGANGFSLRDGGMRLALFDTQADADKGKAAMRRFTQVCYIGLTNTRPNRLQYVMTYLQLPSGLSPIRGPGPVCNNYDPSTLKVTQNADTSWTLASSTALLQVLDNSLDANLALAIAKIHTYQCFIGLTNNRPNHFAYIFEFWV